MAPGNDSLTSIFSGDDSFGPLNINELSFSFGKSVNDSWSSVTSCDDSLHSTEPSDPDDSLISLQYKPNIVDSSDKPPHSSEQDLALFKQQICDMCDKSPFSNTSPIQLNDVEKEYSLTGLKRDCIKVCKTCSSSLSDLINQELCPLTLRFTISLFLESR